MKIEYKNVIREKFYAVLSKESAAKEEAWLNELGEEGWELINYEDLYNNDFYRFKRCL